MNNQLQNKLLNYEVMPPNEAWNKIESALADSWTSFSGKLLQFEETPPASVWEKINQQLDAPAAEEAKVVPFLTRYRKPLQYSGAMVIFVVAAIIVSLLISKKTESESPLDKVMNAGKATNKIDEIKQKRNKAIYNSEFNSTSVQSISPETNEIIISSLKSDQYMIINDGNGNKIRLAKKIYASFECSINNLDCKERLKKLKRKFASCAITSDFTGVLDILKNLQENQ